MSIYVEVNANLHTARYRYPMITKRRRPGSPKGQTKPAKRVLDSEFPKRLKASFALRPGLDVPQLAREVGCTRAVLHNYRKGKNKTIEALLLFKMADALGVSARWLLTKEGAMAKIESLTPDQARVLQTFSQLADEGTRDFWIAQGEELQRRQPSLVPSVADPFQGKAIPIASRSAGAKVG
jgi:transcriptional regulator with XRE-family HTH domain